MTGPSVFCICSKPLIFKETDRTKNRTKTPFQSGFLVRFKYSKIKHLADFKFLLGPVWSAMVRSGPKSQKLLKINNKNRTEFGPKSDRAQT